MFISSSERNPCRLIFGSKLADVAGTISISFFSQKPGSKGEEKISGENQDELEPNGVRHPAMASWGKAREREIVSIEANLSGSISLLRLFFLPMKSPYGLRKCGFPAKIARNRRPSKTYFSILGSIILAFQSPPRFCVHLCLCF